MLIRGTRRESVIYSPDGDKSRLWMPMKRGLADPTYPYIQKLEALLRPFGYHVGHCGASGFSGGGGTSTDRYVIHLLSSSNNSVNPIASTTLLWGHSEGPDAIGGGADDIHRMPIPIASTLVAVTYLVRVTAGPGIAGINNTHSLRKNNTMDTGGIAFNWDTVPVNKGHETPSLAFALDDDVMAKVVVGAYGASITGGRFSAAGIWTVP